MYRRHLTATLRAALADTRVVFLQGARQTGKSTLVRGLVDELGGTYLTLDDPAVQATAREDPYFFASSTRGLTVIDEVQFVPSLFPAIKRVVDNDPSPGRFLLTGSASVHLLPTISESLAGRIELIQLGPLTQSEIEGTAPDFLTRAFKPASWSIAEYRTDRQEICSRILRGGFPEAVARTSSERRTDWFGSYISTILRRDIRDLAQIEGIADLSRLVALVAARVGGLMNNSDLSRSLSIPYTTLRRYLGLLEATFMVQPLPAWSSNLGNRLLKSPKGYLVDSGLTASLRGETDAEALAFSGSLGPLLENFVLAEIRQQLTTSAVRAEAFHFRTIANAEVDIVLDSAASGVVGIEIKASSSVGRSDFSGLRSLADNAQGRFTGGYVLYLGDRALPFGDRYWAVPVSALWSGTP